MITDLPKKSLKRLCPLCGHDQGMILHDLEFRLFDDCPLPSAFDIVVCRQCGFVFYDTLCTENDILAYYIADSSYSNTRTTGAGGDSPLERQRFAFTVDYLKNHVRDNNSILFDIGCGRGGLLRELKNEGFTRLYAVDMIPACIDYIAKSLSVEGDTGSACDIPFREIKADVLVYSHLLEHVYDLPRAISHARERLDKDGLVYVEVPDARRYGQYFITPFYYFFLEHLNHFDSYQMNNLFTSNGFELIESGEKVITAAMNIDIPCIYFMFQKTDRLTKKQLSPSFELAEVMIDYIDLCRSRENHKSIERLRECQESVYVWGLSQNTMRLVAQTPLGDCNIKYFIDNDENKQHKTINGLPVHSQKELLKATDKDVVIIAVQNYRNEIIDYLRSIQFAGSILTLD